MWFISVGTWGGQVIFLAQTGSLSGHRHVLTVSGEGCELCSAGTGRTACMSQASLATSCFLHLGHPPLVTQRPSGMHV